MLILIVVVISCNQPTKSTYDNIKLVEQYFNFFNKHEWDKMAGMYTETAEFKDPALGNSVVKQNRKMIFKKYSALHNAFQNINDSVLQIYSSGDKHVFVEFISKGTAPGGFKFELQVCTIFTIEKGRISRDFTYYDNFEASN